MADLLNHVAESGFPFTDRLIHLFVGGSELHGAKVHGTDDLDIYGVYVEPPDLVLGLDSMPHFVWSTAGDERRNGPKDVDITLYSLKKWAGLACKGNPTALHFLFAKGTVQNPIWTEIVSKRHLFLARSCANQFTGFASDQLKRMTGQKGRGKKGQRPELEEKYGYDVKAGMHVLRLLYECQELVSTGKITLPRPERDLLTRVRTGKYSMDKVLAMAQKQFAECEEAARASSLPGKIDRPGVSKALGGILSHSLEYRELSRHMSKDFATSIIQTLRQQGFQAYLAGGCVRDLLLKRNPADYDVATSATPTEVMEIFPDTYAVGAQFGVVLVPLPEEQRANKDENTLPKSQAVEVATFRSDLGYSDGRRPDEVRFSQDPRQDVARRDFTINGMMFDPVSGEVLDFVGGRKDLDDGIIRAIGDAERRFAEDKLRMLRAIRFAARFEYVIEETTLAAIRRHAHEIGMVSRERVRDELTKMLVGDHARRAFLLLDESGLLAEVLPEIAIMKGVAQPPEFHPEGDVFVHTLLLLDNLPHPCPSTLAWGALLHDVGKPATFRVAPDRIRFDNHVDVGVKIAEEICERLRFSNDDTAQVLALVDNHMRFGHVSRMKESTLKKFLRIPKFDEHLALHRADSLASYRHLSTYDFIQAKLAEIPPEEIRPTALISGDDLIAAGYVPGPRFREILEAVEDSQLEGRLLSRDAALEFVRQTFPL